jgi:hypothetical protein
MRCVETVEWSLGSTNLIPLDLGLPNEQGSTHSTVSTLSTIKRISILSKEKEEGR